ncbi:chromatin assembly factor 1 subunit A isoform X1 [Sorex araneus]|uniref:chromatin assembly factor 1 subunit A isoform X1 n=1 Tax=Sorex araneus TaxID=42254 RepID=UPI002434011A|nr:chromatin assembly factor 1 subunit A isoform X1 [Sorex araneus]
MLEEPECVAPGVRGAASAMDCKDRPTFPVKKLIQARLPFKRLNLVPKEKTEDEALAAPPHSDTSNLGPSLDTLEHECRLSADRDFQPKLVNGKGPLDHFLRDRDRSIVSSTPVIIDLTEDSNDQADIPMTHSKLNEDASTSEEAPSDIREPRDDEDKNDNSKTEEVPQASEEGGLISAEDSLLDSPCHTKDEVAEATVGAAGPWSAGRSGPAPESWHLACQDLIPGLSIYPQAEQDCWRRAGNILYKEGRLPVVVLRDVLASGPLPVALPLGALPDVGERSESEVPDSGPEDDSVLSQSSLSSSSLTASSPEALAAPCKESSSPQHPPTSTPVNRISKKLVRDSAEKNKRRLQRDKERLGKQLKLQAEKEEKEKLKEEARRAKEEARRRREEEKELRERERRERRAKDERERAEKQRRREERRKEKQEALEAKQEEKRKKEEEKRLREEEKRIKAEKAEITRFFQKPKTPAAPKTLAGSCGKFAPFEIKEHMFLAPVCRMPFDQDLCDQLDRLLQQQSSDCCFLQELRARQPLSSGATVLSTRSTELSNSDVVIVESGKVDSVPERKKFGRMKLLQFSENHRPAYWGTWNKTTAIIRPRWPWAQDRDLLDYEVDSDDEWEEEEPGESLSHSEGDEDDEVGEDEDEDDGFFVPHGYLSEDEGVTEECADLENHKVRQKLKAKEWDEFLAKGKRFRVLQPVKIGCLWEAGGDQDTSEQDLKVLQQFRVCPLEMAPLEEEQVSKASRRHKWDQQILAQLLPLLHGNVNGSKAIIREFQECCRRGLLDRDSGSPESSPGSSRPQTPTTTTEDTAVPSKALLKRLISENSVYEKRPDFRMCWYVHPHVLRAFEQEHLPVPCQWNYVTMVPAASREDTGSVPAAGPSQGTAVSLKRKSTSSMCITQFMKKRRHEGQVGTGDLDGFQADTEEEEEEDGACVIMDISDGGEAPAPTGRPGVGDSGEGPAPGSLLGAY